MPLARSAVAISGPYCKHLNADSFELHEPYQLVFFSCAAIGGFKSLSAQKFSTTWPISNLTRCLLAFINPSAGCGQ
jgi:hypothetical protein